MEAIIKDFKTKLNSNSLSSLEKYKDTQETNLYNYLTLFILIIIFVILYMTIKSTGFKKYSLLMILGGAKGNI